MASTIAVANETRSSAVRSTKDGRNIRYALQVIQQPERARACGSGAKSSADRRPVDPPPIVELKVFEGDQDITFGYNANFFLFATLENARSIAPGRAAPNPQSFPVLTGTPVAGMAYLDRPSPAGYFIFPDLSVRHEGKYRLSFALYEELKDPKDMDPEDRSSPAHTHGQADNHVSHRLEVKSAPFVVFSAKKFPGLSESTALSRMVAEQGCRVRIRRDVRMRRRENKSNKDWDEFEDDGGYDGPRRASAATPENYAQQQGMPTPNPALDADNRPRSVSNASNASFAPPRRLSVEEMQPSYQATNGYQQMPPPHSNSYSQVPQYNASQSTYQNQYAPPQPPAPLMQPPQTSYSQSHQPSHNYQSHSNVHMGQSYGYRSYQPPPSHYEQPAPVRQEPAVDYAQPDYRRSSIAQPSQQQYPGPSQIMSSYGSGSGSIDYGRQQIPQPLSSPNHITPVSSSASSHMSNGHGLAPIRTVLADNKLEPVSPSYQSPPNNMSAPMSATSEIAPHHAYMDSHAQYNTQPQVQSQASIGQKRSYSTSFDTRHLDARLQQGARPNPNAPGYQYDNVMDNGSPDMEEPMSRSAMSYRRADGSHRSRPVPVVDEH